MASRKDLMLMSLACLVIKKQSTTKTKRPRSKWVKEWLLRRYEYSHVNLLSELRLHPADWHNYLRMDEEIYLELLAIISPLIKKSDTQMRPAITAHEKLTATLRFLATGRSYEDLKFTTIISPQALGRIIPETCEALYTALKTDYLKFPSTVDEWKQIACDFERKWNFPHCLGAVDGKHIRIQPPAKSGSYFWNYKQYNSLVLMAICNANYEFILCDFGTNGRISDGGVINNTLFYDNLQKGTLNIPAPEKLSNSARQLPFVFIGDEAFALRPDFLKPFSQRDLTHDRKIYNYRLSRTRRIIENTFGILVARFKIFHTAIAVDLPRIDKIVMAACVLHNFLRHKCSNTYITPECVDHEDFICGAVQEGLRGDTVAGLQHGHNRHAPGAATTVREAYMNYFNNEGAVPWQENMIQ